MKRFFLDTSYLVALVLSSDQNHKLASEHWKKLATTQLQLTTTTYIFTEVVTLLNARNHHDKAVETGNYLQNPYSTDLICVDAALFSEGWQYFQQHSDKSYSFTDCISFLVMESLNIHTALTFDRHFVQAGFEKSP
jgi:uncharacterized protein